MILYHFYEPDDVIQIVERDLEISWSLQMLRHWGRVTHICVIKLTTITSDNGLSPGWRQAIIWTNAIEYC